MSYVEVPAERILAHLKAKGFEDWKSPSREIVYGRAHHIDPRYQVLVYTSIRRGRTTARGKGKDAIRVCAIFDDPERGIRHGIAKRPRVHRTGSIEAVLERMIERAREAYAICNDRIRR